MTGGYDFYDMDPFFRDMGALQTKFFTLEYELRTFLFRNEDLPFMRDFDSIAEGDELDANPFTNRDSLGPLIDKYNAVVKHRDPELVVDRRVVDIRDAIAHGRVYRRSVEGQLRLLKFSKVGKDGKVRAEFVETLDRAALGKWNMFLFMTVKRVRDAA